MASYGWVWYLLTFRCRVSVSGTQGATEAPGTLSLTTVDYRLDGLEVRCRVQVKVLYLVAIEGSRLCTCLNKFQGEHMYLLCCLAVLLRVCDDTNQWGSSGCRLTLIYVHNHVYTFTSVGEKNAQAKGQQG